MVKRKALMESISSNLHSFLKKINKNLSLPSKKFLTDAMIACFFDSVCFIGHPFQNGLDLRFVDIQIITVERVTFILSK
jgi:hypothetical protein